MPGRKVLSFMKRKSLTSAEEATRRKLLKESGGDAELALTETVQRLHMARGEEARLGELVKAQRLEIQRLSFPGIYPPDCPEGDEAVAARIYEVAAHIVALMEREQMQGNYDVTYNSMVEIAGYGQPLVAG